MSEGNDIRVAMIVAMADNRAIGRNNQLLWHISADLRHFKQVTMGKPMVMGRKTYESIGRPLPGRTSIVVSRAGFTAPGVLSARDVDTALTLAREAARKAGVDELVVIGGEQIYRALLPQASRLYVTQVHADYEADAFFPELDENGWRECQRERVDGDPGAPCSYSFVLLER